MIFHLLLFMVTVEKIVTLPAEGRLSMLTQALQGNKLPSSFLELVTELIQR